ncbi:MAG: hypothetical protein KQH59_18465 [Desulfobulbaceae bacterium]|nr:hypothetical protein [Desulfobulbaceae bacterium]
MSGTVRRIIATEVEYEPLSEEERFTEEEQLDQCCEEVSVDECADVGKVSRFISRDQEEWDFDPDALAAEYEQQYGKRFLGVELHAVGPQGDCGVKEERWEGRLNCCDEVEPLVYDFDDSADVLVPGTSGVIRFTGGRLPVLVSVRGNGFSLDGYNQRDGWVDGPTRAFRVYAHDFACGTCPITLSDGCSVDSGEVRATVGQWDGFCNAVVTFIKSGPHEAWSYAFRDPDPDNCNIPTGTYDIAPNGEDALEVHLSHWRFDTVSQTWDLIATLHNGFAPRQQYLDIVAGITCRVVGDQSELGEPDLDCRCSGQPLCRFIC